MNPKKTAFLAATLAALICFTSGCTTTSQQNGVSIQKKHSLNPLDYIPYLGK